MQKFKEFIYEQLSDTLIVILFMVLVTIVFIVLGFFGLFDISQY